MKGYIKFLLEKLFWGGFRHLLTDRWYANIRYWIELDKWPNLDNPQKFTEKIQWIKLNEHTDLRRQAANRTTVRSYISQKIGDQYSIPYIGSYKTLTEEVWASLPEQFVLKANHGSGMLKIVPEKRNEQFKNVRQLTEQWKATDYFAYGREWAYKGLPRTIVAEELLLTQKKTIPEDYKFFCFHGEVKVIQIDSDRFGAHKQTLFNRSFNRIEGRLAFPPSSEPIPKPAGLQKAIEIAETLAEDFSFIRVDLYILDGKIYFGELTNYPLNGFIPFKPKSLEYKIGSFLNL